MNSSITFNNPTITYSSTNKAHHFSYAIGLAKMGLLNAFITGASRITNPTPVELEGYLVRCDEVQTLYLLSLRMGNPCLSRYLDLISTGAIDRCSYSYAMKSKVFLYYRTTGLKSIRKIKRNLLPTLCVMEEVNSHVDNCLQLMVDECLRCGIEPVNLRNPDHELRLKCYEESDLILCPSKFVYDSFIARGFPAAKLIINNFGVRHTPSHGNTLGYNHDQTNKIFRILYVGQIHVRKGLRYLIQAFDMLPYTQKELVIVGPNVRPTGLEKICIPDRVRFTGPLRGKELEQEYKNASVFVLPSLEEGLALVISEAVSYGLPIVATRSSGAEDVIVENDWNHIVPPADPLAIKDKLEIILDHLMAIGRGEIDPPSPLETNFVDWNTASYLLAQKLTHTLKNSNLL
jgi:glycosyltransferase involved in cell wall biosynthesis